MSTNLKQIKFYVTAAQREHIQSAAQTLDMGQSDMIRLAISEFLEKRNLEALPDDLNPQGVRKDYQEREDDERG